MQEQNRTILVVDVSIQARETLEQLLADAGYKVILAGNVSDGLEMLKHQPVDVVLCDWRTPGMDGYAMLKTVKKLYPNTLRLLMGEGADEQSLLKAINENIAKTFIPKPWHDRMLIQCLQDLLQVESTLRESNILDKINSLDHLPNAMRSCQAILGALEDEVPPDALAELISHNQALTAELMRLVNSAYYNQRTTSIRHAVVYLGFENIRNLVLANMAFNAIGVDYAKRESTHECRQVSVLARRFMAMVFYELYERNPDVTQLCAGLLCNIGASMISAFYADQVREYETMLRAPDPQVLRQYELERLGFTHDHFGASLLHWWGLPYHIVEATLYYRDPYNPRVVSRQLVALTTLCADVARHWIYGVDLNPEEALLIQAVLEREPFMQLVEHAYNDPDVLALLAGRQV